MKSFANYLIWLTLLTFCLGCKPKTPEPLADGTPRIISIKFPGIPAEDVSIDQHNYVITVKVPPLLPSELEPEVQVTENADLQEVNWHFVFVKSIYFEPSKIHLSGSNREATAYTFEFIPAGPLEFVDTNTLLEYTIRSGSRFLDLPVRNLYANGMLHYVRMTNRGTKEIILLENLHNVANAVYAGWEKEMNMIRIFMNSRNSIPGTYDLEVVTKEGISTKYPQPFIIKKGAVELPEFSIFGYQGVQGKSVGAGGANLYEGEFTLDLIDSTGQVTPLRDIKYEKAGHQFYAVIPTTVRRNAHYVIRFTQNDGGATSCGRVHTREEEFPLLRIVALGDSPFDCSISGPVELERGKPTNIVATGGSTNPIVEGTTNRRLKLVAVADPAKIYLVLAPMPPPSDPINPRPPIVIPPDIPAGQYRVSLVMLDAQGEIAEEGARYFRIVEVR